jgi:exoribonuclease II
MEGAPGLAILAKIIGMKGAGNLHTKIVFKSSSIKSGSRLIYN